MLIVPFVLCLTTVPEAFATGMAFAIALVVRGWLFCLSAFYGAARVCSQGSPFNSCNAGHLHLHSQGISEELRPILPLSRGW